MNLFLRYLFILLLIYFAEALTNDSANEANKTEEAVDDVKEYATKALKAHNALRKIHESPDMKLNDNMTQEATEYAKKLLDTEKFEHSGVDDGENLAVACYKEDNEFPGEDATKYW